MLEKFDLSGNRLPAMEGLRAYAAFIVFFVHAVILTQPVIGNGVIALYLQSSQHGVDVFFLLSGFLITGLVLKETFNFKKFLAHRLARIYPAFLVSLIFFGTYHELVLHEHISLTELLANLVFLNGAYPLEIRSISSVTWSLFFEFNFYLWFPLLMLPGGTPARRLTIATLVAVPIIVALCFIDVRYARFAMFLAGAWLRVLPPKLIPDRLVIALYLAATTAFMFAGNWAVFIALFVIPAFLLVRQAIYGRGILNRFFSLHPLRLFGKIAVFLGGFAVSVFIAAVSFLLFEKPYFRQKAAARQSPALT